MSTTTRARPAAGSVFTVAGLISALLLLAALLAVAVGPELLGWAFTAPGMKLVPYYLLAVVGLLEVGVLLWRGGGRPEGVGPEGRASCRRCGAPNDGHARFCNQCAAPF